MKSKSTVAVYGVCFNWIAFQVSCYTCTLVRLYLTIFCVSVIKLDGKHTHLVLQQKWRCISVSRLCFLHPHGKATLLKHRTPEAMKLYEPAQFIPLKF